MDVAHARRLERPGWLNGRTLLGLLLFTTSLVAGQRLIESGRQTVPVWIAAHDLSSGAVLGAGELVLSNLTLPRDTQGLYALGATELEGAVLTRAVSAGEMIPLSSVVPPGSEIDGRLVAIPVVPEHAVGGELRPGDRVDVFATLREGQSASTERLVAGVEVVDVVRADDLLVGQATMAGITVLVDPFEAARIIHAIRVGEIDVVRVIGPSGSDGVDPISSSGVAP